MQLKKSATCVALHHAEEKGERKGISGDQLNACSFKINFKFRRKRGEKRVPRLQWSAASQLNLEEKGERKGISGDQLPQRMQLQIKFQI